MVTDKALHKEKKLQTGHGHIQPYKLSGIFMKVNMTRIL